MYLLDIAAPFIPSLSIPVVIRNALHVRSLEKLRYLLTISSFEDKNSKHPCTRPLRPEIESGSVEAVKMLLQAGADPREGTECDKYHPADSLQEAASRGYLSMVDMLLDYGADDSTIREKIEKIDLLTSGKLFHELKSGLLEVEKCCSEIQGDQICSLDFHLSSVGKMLVNF